MEPVVATVGLTKIFQPPGLWFQRRRRNGPRAVTALDNVTLEIYPGDIFGLVGRNGQGKTTLIKSLATLIEPTKGSIRIFGLDAARHAREIKGKIGLVAADERSFYGRLTCRQNLMFFARLNGLGGREAHKVVGGLSDLFEFGSMLDRRFHELSSGNKQRLALMRAMLIDPPLLLLDEPTRSLDPMAADELRALIRDRLNRDQKKTFLITSHNLQEVEGMCNRVGFLSRGQIKLCATMHDLRTRYYNQERVTILAAGISAENGLSPIFATLSDLELEQTREGHLKIRFKRSLDDDHLHTLLAGLVEHHAKILSCTAESDVLRDILTGIEN